MADWDLDMLSDGQAGTAASLNVPLADALAAINDLENDTTRRGTFNHDHAPTVVAAALTSVDKFTKAVDGGIHIYPLATFGTDITYSAFGTDGGTMAAPLTGGARWTIIGHPSQTGPFVGSAARISYSNPGLTITDDGDVNALLVLLNCDLYDIHPNGDDCVVAVCIQVLTTGSATWHTLPHTERFYSANDHVMVPATADEHLNLDMVIRTVITEDVLAAIPATGGITDLRAMVSLVDPAVDAILSLHRFTFTAIPLRLEVQ